MNRGLNAWLVPAGSFSVEDKQESVACIPQAIATPFSGGIHAFRRSVVVQSTQRRISLFKATQFNVISRRSNQSSAGQGGGSEGFLHGPTRGDPNHSAIPHLLMRGILKRAQPPPQEKPTAHPMVAMTISWPGSLLFLDYKSVCLTMLVVLAAINTVINLRAHRRR